MKSTLIFTGIFIIGLLFGSHSQIINFDFMDGLKTGVLDVLLLLIGVGIGFDTASQKKTRKINPSGIAVPIFVGAGSIFGTGLVAALFPGIGFHSGMAVGDGFGFYSLSSVILTDLRGIELGTIALITNLVRELFTILSTPLLAKWFGRMAPIASAGANSMDITLPLIQRYSGKQYTLVAIFNGVVLTIMVSVLVPLLGR